MIDDVKEKTGLTLACWRSFRSLPLWVQIWVSLILMPLNMASIAFLGEPSGVLIATLAISAMMLNLPVMIRDRGFSKLMAVPHLLPWTALVLAILFWRPEGSPVYDAYLSVLMVTNIISLAFDYPDAWAWWRGKRDVA